MPGLEAQEVFRIFESMKGRRANWENHWQEVSDLICPDRQFVGKVTAGEKRTSRIFDSTAITEHGRLASALSGLLTNPSLVWFFLTTGVEELDEDEDVRDWLWRVGRVILGIFNSPQVGFYQSSAEVYMDLVGYGTGVMHVKSSSGSALRMKSLHLSQCYIEENSDGMVDTLGYSFVYTAAQALHEFGMDKLPEKIKKSLEAKQFNDEFSFAQIVLPRHVRDVFRKDRANMAWASYVICTEPGYIVSESGFREFPFVCPRWKKMSGEVYGRAPGMDVLPSVKMANSIARTILVSAEKVCDPPLQMPDDGFISPLATYPGGINYYRSGSRDRVEPLYTGARFDVSENELMRHQDAIRRGFFSDLFHLPQSDRMTATEVLQRQKEQMQLLNPIVGRLISEFLGPMISRTFHYAVESGMIPDAPEELRGRQMTVQYTSPLAQSQKASEATNFTQFIAVMAPLVESDPTIMSHIDPDKAVHWARGMYNLPPIFRKQAEVTAMREAQQQAAQEQQQAAVAAEQAKAIKDVSLSAEPIQTLTETLI